MVSLERTVNVFLGIVILCITSALSFIYWAPAYQPPIKYLSIAIMNKDMKSGDMLRGRVTFDRRRNCPATSYRAILKVNPSGEDELVHRDVVTQGATEIGESINLIFTMPLPKLEPGNYTFRATARFDCDGHIFTIELPTAGFNVVQ